jgi:cytochrome c biogenesis protein CcdA
MKRRLAAFFIAFYLAGTVTLSTVLVVIVASWSGRTITLWQGVLIFVALAVLALSAAVMAIRGSEEEGDHD